MARTVTPSPNCSTSPSFSTCVGWKLASCHSMWSATRPKVGAPVAAAMAAAAGEWSLWVWVQRMRVILPGAAASNAFTWAASSGPGSSRAQLSLPGAPMK
jgi:hypothetical protein